MQAVVKQRIRWLERVARSPAGRGVSARLRYPMSRRTRWGRCSTDARPKSGRRGAELNCYDVRIGGELIYRRPVQAGRSVPSTRAPEPRGIRIRYTVPAARPITGPGRGAINLPSGRPSWLCSVAITGCWSLDSIVLSITGTAAEMRRIGRGLRVAAAQPFKGGWCQSLDAGGTLDFGARWTTET